MGRCLSDSSSLADHKGSLPMGVHTRSPRATMLSVGALWAVFLIPAMLDCIEPARAASLETYGRLPTLEDIALSPDGSKLAFVHTRENERMLGVTQLSPNKFIGGAKVGEI